MAASDLFRMFIQSIKFYTIRFLKKVIHFQNSLLFERLACFYVTISGNFERFQYLTLKQIFWKAKTFFKKLVYRFLVESTKIGNASFPYKTVMSKANVKIKRMMSTKWTFFFYLGFFHEHSLFTGQQGKGEGIFLTPLYHFQPLHRHLDISRAITAESSPLHIASSRTRTGNL